MFQTIQCWLLFCLALSSTAMTLRADPLVFYVSPSGNDAWSGTVSKPRKGDGPFATLERARDQIRELKSEQGGSLTQAVTVILTQGMHYRSTPFELTPEDSGTADAPVTYQAAKAGKTWISGGRRITGWQTTSLNGNTVWRANVPEAANGQWFFHELWVNGERAIRARSPNKGYFQIAGFAQQTPDWETGNTEFLFHPGDIQNWSTVTNAEVVVMSLWTESHLPIVSVDEGQHIVRFGKSSVFQLQTNDLYYVEHAIELLDAPGEWYLNQTAGTLYYYPRPGERMSSAEVIAPVLNQVVRIEGAPETGDFVENLRFRGLTFAHTEWFFPPDFIQEGSSLVLGGIFQAASEVPGAVYAEGARGCSWEACSFTHIGTYGIELSRGCQSNRVVACDMDDLGAGGVKLGEADQRDTENEVASNNEVSDCEIGNGGRLFHGAVGVWLGETHHNTISHNHIHDFYYTGISVGWTWGYDVTFAHDNALQSNLIENIGVLSDKTGPILSDLAAVYTLGTQPGTTIDHNIVHTIAARQYGGWGIYLDEGSSEILVENNLVYDTSSGGFNLHYGQDNEVRNNVLAYGRETQVHRTIEEDHLSLTFDHNIVVWSEGELFGGAWNSNVNLDYNVYFFDGKGDFDFDGYTYGQWLGLGRDTHSLLDNPSLKKMSDSGVQISSKSPALDIGFTPLDLSDVGPRPDVVKSITKGK